MTGCFVAFVLGAWFGIFIAAVVAAGKDKENESN